MKIQLPSQRNKYHLFHSGKHVDIQWLEVVTEYDWVVVQMTKDTHFNFFPEQLHSPTGGVHCDVEKWKCKSIGVKEMIKQYWQSGACVQFVYVH